MWSGRRPDGYHLLQSVFTLIDLRGPAALSRSRRWPRATRERASRSAREEDLVVRAARALQAATGTSLGADIEVDKRIPMGGGLGGGSSDAATALMVLARLWSTRLDAEALGKVGATIGADIPFFVFGRPAWVEGVGERLTGDRDSARVVRRPDAAGGGRDAPRFRGARIDQKYGSP
jgi:4-diphosphocytidyl-2-C-methyl-D-erythritol kinase